MHGHAQALGRAADHVAFAHALAHLDRADRGRADVLLERNFDLGKDLVTLNMVKDVAVNGNDVSFTVVLTTPACPMKDMIKNACVNAVKLLVNKEANVQVNFTSNTTTKRTDEGNVLPRVKNIIAVISGSGGVKVKANTCR